MDLVLPSGLKINGVPDNLSRDEIKSQAIERGLSTESDFIRNDETGDYQKILALPKMVEQVDDETHAQATLAEYYKKKTGREYDDQQLNAAVHTDFGENTSFQSALSSLQNQYKIETDENIQPMVMKQKNNFTVGEFLRSLSGNATKTAYGTTAGAVRFLSGIPRHY